MLKVSRMPSGEPEIFHSIQGEGVSAGRPSVFLRLATCNLTCSWCDTKYTWDWERYDYREQIVSLEASDVRRRLDVMPCRHLVVTGGEPMLQQSELAPLARSLSDGGWSIEVETNGTIAPSSEMAAAVSQWNVSPKTSNSGNGANRREAADVLRAFAELPKVYFKFVVAEPADVDEVAALVERHSLPESRVLLMPEGTTAKAIRERGEWVAEQCVQRGYRFTTRLHIVLWGDERGR